MADPRTDLDARLEAEIESALGDTSMWDLLDEGERPAGAGDARSDRPVKRGTIVSVHGNDVMVEFGPRSQGVCDIAQFDAPPKPGEQHEFLVDRFDKTEGLLVLSKRGAISKAAWDSLDVGQIVEGRCTAVNKGGLEIEVAQHRGFMPAGQCDIRHVPDLAVFIDQKLPCEIIELDRRSGRMILSRRSFLEAERARRREEVLAKLDVGQEITGEVTSVMPYGAFVDIGGVDGLIHVSDLSYSRITDPKSVIKVGDKVTVKVLKIDDSEDPPRIGLGLKQTMADPFKTSANTLAEGGTVSGRVTKIMPFGAFVEIAPGIEGLIHISELAHDRVHDVSRHVKTDEIVTVKVLSIDHERQRIALSLKALLADKEEQQERKTDNSMARLRAKFGSGDRPLKGGIG